MSPNDYLAMLKQMRWRDVHLLASSRSGSVCWAWAPSSGACAPASSPIWKAPPGASFRMTMPPRLLRKSRRADGGAARLVAPASDTGREAAGTVS